MEGPAPSQPDDPEAVVRETAIDLYLAGHKPVTIYRRLQRSRTWFYDTLARYRAGGRAGLTSQSRAPKCVRNRTPEEVEATIVRLRRLITSGTDPELRYANVGAASLAAELERLGIPPPHRATIYRILGRHDLVPPQPQKKKQKRSLPDDYPWPQVQAPNDLHLLDFVVRSIRGEGRFYSCHLLDQFRRWPFLRAITPKSAALVSQFLVQAWQDMGLASGLYIDNDAVWNGGGRGQRVLSFIVRLCLLVGVEVIFIPPYTYEANPIIESFNRVWDRNFWGRTTFRDLDHVQSELVYFEHYCRHRRPLAEFEHRMADQIASDFEPVLLPATFDQHQQPRLPITAGQVHFIRFVSSTGTVSILNEQWSVNPERWAGKTIRATVDTEQQQLLIYHQPKDSASCELVAQFDYPVGEAVVPLADEFRRERPAFWPPVAE